MPFNPYRLNAGASSGAPGQQSTYITDDAPREVERPGYLAGAMAYFRHGDLLSVLYGGSDARAYVVRRVGGAITLVRTSRGNAQDLRARARRLLRPPGPVTLPTGTAVAVSKTTSATLVSSIPAARQWAPVSNPGQVRTLTRGAPIVLQRSSGASQWQQCWMPKMVSATKTGTDVNSAAWSVELMTDAQVIEWTQIDRAEMAWRIAVDGTYRPVTGTGTPNASYAAGEMIAGTAPGSTVHARYRADFGSRAIRKVRLDLVQGVGCFFTGPLDSVWLPDELDPIQVIWIGDSFFEGDSGTPLVPTVDSMAWRASRLLGWRDVWNCSVGGTGHLRENTARQVAGELTAYRQRTLNRILPYGPPADVIVLGSAYNDLGGSTPAAVVAEMSRHLDLLRATWADAVIFVMGPWSNGDALPAGATNPQSPAIVSAMNVALRSACAARDDVTFVDHVGEAWITGSTEIANAATPGNTGNQDRYIGNDNLHPSDAGAGYYAQRIAETVRARLNAWAAL